MENLGRRIRQLRDFRGIGAKDCVLSRGNLSKVEHGHEIPSLGKFERICERLNVAPAVLLGPQEAFDALFVDDSFVLEIRSLLKFLSAEQRAFILKTLEAAPKLKSRRSANTGEQTSTD